MPLETGTYISDLVATNPTGADGKNVGDDHLRLIKLLLRNTFPNITGAVTPTHLQFNYVAGVTSAIQAQIDGKGAIAGQAWTGAHSFAGTTTLAALTSTGASTFAGSVAFSGATTAPTKAASDNSTNVATTAYTDTAVGNALSGGASTSTTSQTVSAAAKTLTTQTNKPWATGQWINVARTSDPVNTRMTGIVTAYNSGTGQLDYTVTAGNFSGSGTFTDWTITSSGPPIDPAVLAAKLDKVNGISQSTSVTYLDKGTIAAAGTAALNYAQADHQRVQAGGNITLTLSGWPAAGSTAELLLEAVNFGGKTITWPTVNWVKADGSFTTTVSSNGVTFQGAGIDFVLLWSRDGGVTVYGKVMR
ncbi:hypothetical protein VLK31_34930 [Variovorax sp. H27-G14]|uniref:hypothetical protein n=1 Tax=Variovorax sp. H27-G14 TaxID=3111914 RepID=UPI0038FC1FAA